MLSKLRNMWALARKDPQKLDKLLEVPEEVLNQVPDQADGKAVFFSEGTEEDFAQFEAEQSGMGKWLDRLKNLV